MLVFDSLFLSFLSLGSCVCLYLGACLCLSVFVFSLSSFSCPCLRLSLFVFPLSRCLYFLSQYLPLSLSLSVCFLSDSVLVFCLCRCFYLSLFVSLGTVFIYPFSYFLLSTHTIKHADNWSLSISLCQPGYAEALSKTNSLVDRQTEKQAYRFNDTDQ